MANTGTLRVTLHGVDSEPAVDRSTRVSIFRGGDNTQLQVKTHNFGPPLDLKVPAFPQEKVLSGHITPSRYRSREIGFFTVTDGETIERKPTVFRTPSEWTASFTKWSDLTTKFAPLRRVLHASTELRVKSGKKLGRFTEQAYDDVETADRVTTLAKTAMLNLFAKLMATDDPVGGAPWFRALRSLLVIDRERFVAVVEEGLLTSVRKIKAGIDKFPEYKNAPVGDHTKNVPDGFKVRKSDLLSVKTQEKNGNLQLTVGPATAADGSTVILLDADIDENGQLMKHLADVFKHRFNGGTHPYDIHEFLVIENRQRDLGYELV